MREILFRGKRTDNGKWVEGELLHDMQDRPHLYWKTPKELPIVFSNHAIVDPATLGQFTGMTDKNDKKIFEGDIVKDESGVAYPVVYGLTGFFLKYAPPHSHGFHYDLLPLSNYWHAHGAIIEVIGNIHDNPELVEVK